MKSKQEAIKGVKEYYDQKILKHGLTPAGVDWNGIESQSLRFRLLSQLIQKVDYSLLDYGCGYGELFKFLKENEISPTQYIGYDISTEMLTKAKGYIGKNNQVTLTNQLDYINSDYCVASGVFNVIPDSFEGDWEEYCFSILNQLNSHCTEGFAFNMLTSYSDKEYMKDYLYYPEPEKIFKYCKENFSRFVSLIHDTPLYEFTVIVRK